MCIPCEIRLLPSKHFARLVDQAVRAETQLLQARDYQWQHRHAMTHADDGAWWRYLVVHATK